MSKMSIIGTGIMGGGVAKTYANLGHEVKIWNRTTSKAESIIKDANLSANNLSFEKNLLDAIEDSEYIFLTLYDYASTNDVLQKIATYVRPETIILQCATIGFNAIKELEKIANQYNLNLIEANMMGSKAQAESGQLMWIVGGEEQLTKKCQTLLENNGAGVVVCGVNLGDASLVKLACNMWISTITLGAAQSIKLLKNSDIDPSLFLKVIEKVPANSPYAHLKGSKMIQNDHSKQFALDALLKDLALAKEALIEKGENRTLLDMIQQLYQNSSDLGHGDDDISAIISEF